MTYLTLKTAFRTVKGKRFEEFQEFLESNTIFIGTSASKTSISVSLSTTRSRFWMALDVLRELLLEPGMYESDFSEVKRVAIASIRASRDDLFSVLGEALFKASLERPYSHPNMGYESSVGSIELDDVKEHWKGILGKRAVLSVVGDIPEPLEKLHSWWEGLRSELKVADDVLPPKASFKPSRAEDALNKLQVGIAIGFRAPSIYDEEGIFSFSVLRQVLSSMSSRLFIELREKRSLAYSVGASVVPYIGDSLFYGYLSTARHKEREALEALASEFLRLKSNPPTDEELRRAKRYMKGLYKMSLQYRSAVASSYASALILKLPLDRFIRYEEKVDAIDEEVLRRYLDALDPSHSVAIVRSQGGQ